MLENFLGSLILPLLYPFLKIERVYWPYLLGALLIAFFAYQNYRKQEGSQQPFSWKNFWTFLFPAEIYRHRSTVQDIKFFYANTAFQTFFLLPVFAFSAPALSHFVQSWMARGQFPGQGIFQGSLAIYLVFTLLMAIALDFSIFLGHYFQHKIPLLWEFHKVHHSAEVLNPLTVYRMHPVDNFLNFGLAAVITGVLSGVAQHFFSGRALLIEVWGVNVIFMFYYLFGYNLRHSHVWVDYGPFWSRIFISPAQHQIHHSCLPKHFDKNIGFIFSCWDRIFGTLYIPKTREVFPLGVGEREQKHFTSLRSLFFRPFSAALNHFSGSLIKKTKVVFVLTAFILPAVFLNYAYTAALEDVDPQVYLENLTWVEVQQKVEAGFDTIILPTGGTEQNGPHMVLGKHNYIVHYTAGRIAQRLGKTLVAPVLAYVPQGDVDSAEGHTRYAGTISVSETVFEGVLESSARSFKAHGFRRIIFLGDSGGNQEAQRKVAQELSRRWASEGVRVLHAGNYYSDNRQLAWLSDQGKNLSEIGRHAGIRDTSELIAVYPEGVRPESKEKLPASERLSLGSDGNPSAAKAETGRAMIRLKIEAAIEQIQRDSKKVDSF